MPGRMQPSRHRLRISADQRFEFGPSLQQRSIPQVLAVHVEKIEGVEEQRVGMPFPGVRLSG
jgi:hypothetical protein